MDNNNLVNKFCIWENTNIQVSDNYENEESTIQKFDDDFYYGEEEEASGLIRYYDKDGVLLCTEDYWQDGSQYEFTAEGDAFVAKELRKYIEWIIDIKLKKDGITK